MGEHTPGPWSYEVHELSEGYSAIVYDARGQRVGTDHLSEADAALIAAAPDLLAAIKDAQDFIRSYFGPVSSDDPAGWSDLDAMGVDINLRAAIAKASPQPQKEAV